MLSKRLKNLSSSSLIYAIPQLVGLIGGLVILPIFTKYLSPSDFGLFALMTVVIGIGHSVASLKLESGLYRYHSEYEGSSKREFLGESKSINIESFLPILKLNKDFDFINLQYGDVEEDLIKLKEKNIELIDLNVDLFNNFEKIAAILKNLDLFITVSNSTAHLAGALNVKTWLIKPKTFALFHYWNQPNFSCPWYPSIRLIEQNKNVDEIINDLKKDLILFKN